MRHGSEVLRRVPLGRRPAAQAAARKSKGGSAHLDLARPEVRRHHALHVALDRRAVERVAVARGEGGRGLAGVHSVPRRRPARRRRGQRVVQHRLPIMGWGVGGGGRGRESIRGCRGQVITCVCVCACLQLRKEGCRACACACAPVRRFCSACACISGAGGRASTGGMHARRRTGQRGRAYAGPVRACALPCHTGCCALRQPPPHTLGAASSFVA